MKIYTLESIPYITKLNKVSGNSEEYEMEGMFAEVFFALQSVLNFTYTLKKPPDGNWGALQSDGTWNGMVRLLQDKEADIGKYFLYLIYIVCFEETSE